MAPARHNRGVPEDPEAAGSPWPQELVEDFVGGSYALHPGEESAVDPEDSVAVVHAARFRETLGRFATGVTVVTGQGPDGPVGLTCQSFSSVSLDPPLVLVCVARTSRAWPIIRESGALCANILAADQRQISQTMATRGRDKFAGLDWEPSHVTGSPVLTGTLGHVDCTIEEVHPAGDHDVVIARVRHLAVQDEASPLIYYRGAYRELG